MLLIRVDPMGLPLAVFSIAALYVLHQDVWLWGEARPLVFGFLPIGLFYHAVHTVASSLLLWVLAKYAWPTHLEQDLEPAASAGLPSPE
jgi:hypothetical protein